jgi:FkbM family methyltransferase
VKNMTDVPGQLRRPLVDADPQTVLRSVLCAGRQFVIQVGANDGVRDDPLHSIITNNPQVNGILIEPLPFYFAQLRGTYAGALDRMCLLNCAISASDTRGMLYFIDAAIANEMDGDGPPNGWAHGQGSFSQDVIVHWIRQNAFRGPNYVANLPRYLEAIRGAPVDCLTLDTICRQRGVQHVDALVIDVQGHELDVLQGLSRSTVRPAYIYYEDDLGRESETIAALLIGWGYEFVCGHANKLWHLAGSSAARTGHRSAHFAPVQAGPDGSVPRVVDVLVTTCCLRDLTTWSHLSELILRYVGARRIRLIVPEADVAAFLAVTCPVVEVISENKILPDLNLAAVAERLPVALRHRAGWYLQQFLKIAACAQAAPDEIVLIWDADTAPIRPLQFVGERGQLSYYISGEWHAPYFETLKSVTGLERVAQFSFIAQCFPARACWVQELISTIEQRQGCFWAEAILRALRGVSPSEFSEYETLGQFVFSRYPSQMEFRHGGWERFGNRVFSNPANFRRFTDLDYFAFEQWDPGPQP